MIHLPGKSELFFPTEYSTIVEKVEAIQPREYSRTRNFVDGAVTRLSPYISRGVISTKMVLDSLLERGFSVSECTKFIQELTWREFFQAWWNVHGNAIDNDCKREQPSANKHGIPAAIVEAATGIETIDKHIQLLYQTGYMHNHVRMYTASLATVFAHTHWRTPAQWMYYHLLDADWVSNALSWQWVAGAFSNKVYVANQENINNYTGSKQRDTFLDCAYEDLPTSQVVPVLQEQTTLSLQTTLPQAEIPVFSNGTTVLLYTMYNLDPLWRSKQECKRVLLLEPSLLQRYPVCDRTLRFVLDLAANIPDIQVCVAEFSELLSHNAGCTFVCKQHPTNKHFIATHDERECMFPSLAYSAEPSFFAFWKKAERLLPKNPLQEELF